VVLSSKMRSLPLANQDAILRHEIGHLIDMFCPKSYLDSLASERGFTLAASLERRADDIAFWLWGDRIHYDTHEVQTLHPGVSPRPEHLGL